MKNNNKIMMNYLVFAMIKFNIFCDLTPPQLNEGKLKVLELYQHNGRMMQMIVYCYF